MPADVEVLTDAEVLADVEVLVDAEVPVDADVLTDVEVLADTEVLVDAEVPVDVLLPFESDVSFDADAPVEVASFSVEVTTSPETEAAEVSLPDTDDAVSPSSVFSPLETEAAGMGLISVVLSMGSEGSAVDSVGTPMMSAATIIPAPIPLIYAFRFMSFLLYCFPFFDTNRSITSLTSPTPSPSSFAICILDLPSWCIRMIMSLEFLRPS